MAKTTPDPTPQTPVGNQNKRNLDAKKKPQWLIMVYMVANVDAELDVAAQRDIREMERGVNENVEVVVQVKRTWPDAPQRFHIAVSSDAKERDGTGRSVLEGSVRRHTNMGAAATLTDFIADTQRKHPAEHYGLVLWGHAYGLGFGRDHGDPLDVKELAGALEAARNKPSGTKLSLLGANACAMSYLEAAYELRECADYLVASQIGVPYAGWPYDRVLRSLESPTSPEDLGRRIVDFYVGRTHAFVRQERASMTLLSLSDASTENLPTLVSRLAEAVASYISEGPDASDRWGVARDILMGVASGDVRPLVDVVDLCKQLKGLDQPTTDAAEALEEAVKAAIKRQVSHPELSHLNGVGIYAPVVTHEKDLVRLELAEGLPQGSGSQRGREKTRGREAYKALSIFEKVKNLAWPTLVYDTLRGAMSDELLKCFDGAGVSSRADRLDVAQLALSIDSAFNRLDRVIDRQRQPVCDALKSLCPAKVKKNGMTQPTESRPQMLIRAGKKLRLLDLSHLKKSDDSSAPVRAKPAPEPVDVPSAEILVDAFSLVEEAIERVEGATVRGLTHATFGLGPLEPTAIGKTFKREDLSKDAGHGGAPRHLNGGKDSGHGSPQAMPDTVPPLHDDLRLDAALTKVVHLFSQVGESLRVLEQAGTAAQTVVRTMLTEVPAGVLPDVASELAATEMDLAFQLLQESATSARRVVRSVLAHPIYGIGPGAPGIGLDERQEMAKAGGLSKARLRLLSPLPKPAD